MNDLNVLNTKHFEIQSSIINPIFGYLLESTGTLSNIRFFGPGMQIIKENNSRDYSKDSSDNSIVRLTLETFPSPAGTLCHIRNLPNNFGFKFQADRDIGIEFLADCFVKMLDSKANTNYKDENECEEFRKVRNILFSLDDEHVFVEIDSKMIKLMIIHSFIINALDNKTSLEKYLKIIIENTKDTHIDIYEVGCNITDEVIKIQQKFRNFPYSEFNQPSSNASVPIYNRKTDKFNFEKKYSDCADILLLNICNCLFYDSENCCYSIKSLNPNSDLAKFYKKHSELFTVTDAIRQDWSKVIQGLDDFEVVNDDEHKTHLIVYLKENRNELKSGIINMMNVLIKICNVDHKAFWKGFDGKDIEEKIIQLFELISPKFEKQTLSLKAYPFSFTKFRSKRRTDFIGNFDLIFKQSNGCVISLMVNVSPHHSEMKFINYLGKTTSDFLYIDPISAFDFAPIAIFKNYFEISHNTPKTNHNVSIFNKIYFSGNIDTNEKKKVVLINICNSIVKYETYMNAMNRFQEAEAIEIKLKILKETMDCILSTINLEDDAMKSTFGPFLFYNNQLDKELMLRYWIFSFSLIRSDVHKLWENVIINLNFDSLNLEVFDIPRHSALTVFKTLKMCKNLKRLRLWGIISENRDLIAEGLMELTDLVELDLSCNCAGLGSEEPNEIIKALQPLTKLTILDLSFNSLSTVNIQILAENIKNFKNLKMLGISKINMKVSDAKVIADALLETPNLEILNISHNYIGIEGIKVILDTMKKLKNIKAINMNFSSFDTLEMKNILEAKEEFESLIKFKN